MEGKRRRNGGKKTGKEECSVRNRERRGGKEGRSGERESGRKEKGSYIRSSFA